MNIRTIVLVILGLVLVSAISDLRQRCSAPAVDDELAESELWNADPAGGTI
jgi:hypothetical protein